MNLLIRLILSIEKLIKNPIKWFDAQPWLVRMLAVLLLVPSISAVSIRAYQENMIPGLPPITESNSGLSEAKLEEILEKHQNTQVEEILHLREEVSALKETVQLLAQESGSELVLGATDTDTKLSLKERLESISASTLSDPNIASVYIRTDDQNVAVFTEARHNSKKITDFQVGTFYPALEETNGWQQIDLGDGRTGWIETKYIIRFPIDENP